MRAYIRTRPRCPRTCRTRPSHCHATAARPSHCQFEKKNEPRRSSLPRDAGVRVSLKSGRRHHLQTITSRRVTDRGRWPQPCAREAE